MKSRLAILTTLALGMFLSTTGAGLAVSGLTGKEASVAQYGHPGTPKPTPRVDPPAPTPTTTTPPAAIQTPAPVAAQPAPAVVQTAPAAVNEVIPSKPAAPAPAAIEEDEPLVTRADDPAPTPRREVAPLQTTRQVESAVDGEQLPFTGLAAIPILVGGVALLGAGAVVRRKTRDE